MDYKQLFGREWYEALKGILESEYWKKLGRFIAEERNTKVVYPEKGADSLFKAFRTTPLSKVKVVILGQDPYHDGSYDGYAFSNSLLKKGRVSPSLMNILKEVHNDIYPETDYEKWLTADAEIINLERWATQGVLLINTAHTVIQGTPDSHTIYWKKFTKHVIKVTLKHKKKIAWVLWGNKAKKIFWDTIDEIITTDEEYFAFDQEYIVKDSIIIQSPHPSPFSAHTGFFGSKPFSRINKFLEKNKKSSIIW